MHTPETPYRLRPVPCFETSRLRLTPQGGQFLVADLLDLQRNPLLVTVSQRCVTRELGVIARPMPDSTCSYVLVFDLPLPFVVRPVLVRDDISDLAAFLRDLDRTVILAVRETLRGLQT